MAEENKTQGKKVEKKTEEIVEKPKEEKPVEMVEKKEEITKPQEKKEEVQKKKTEKIEPVKEEKEFIIPLRRKFRRVAIYKRAPKAIKTVKEYLARHMKLYDRDLNKIKLDKYLNEFLWARGIRNPPFKVKIKAFREGDSIRAELAELPKKLKFKKERLEKREKTLPVSELKKKPEVPPPVVQERTEEEKAEEKEKKAAVIEAGKEMEKAAAKSAKHAAKVSKQPKRQQRKALAK
jgi:large subunit ribosomal protein L31e